MLKLFIRIIAPGFVLAGLLHVFLGLGADVMLGADIPASVLNDASLDSQNRFYGISFTVYGVLLWIASTDLARYRTLLRVLILWFFLGRWRCRNCCCHLCFGGCCAGRRKQDKTSRGIESRRYATQVAACTSRVPFHSTLR
jgi:hypothetical protein